MFLPGISEFETFEKAMYFSLVTFTTLGYGEITIGSANRILAGLEAINGITLIGWSTAFMFAIFQELLKKSVKKKHDELVIGCKLFLANNLRIIWEKKKVL